MLLATNSLSRWRLLRPLLAAAVLFLLFVFYLFFKARPSYELYRNLFDKELEKSRKIIREDPGRKYVLFRQLQGAGFNNQAQEILLFHHLALEAGRTYVYQPVVWQPRGTNALVPLSAFMTGVTRSSVNAAVFSEACPSAETKHVSLRVEHDLLWNHAKEVLGGPEKCIIVDDWIFNWAFLESPALHQIWPSFKIYLGKHFEWSEQIDMITGRTQHDLRLQQNKFHTDGEPYLALHLRRGDFENHCYGLAESGEGFTTWATLPSLQKRSVYPPALDTHNQSSILEHCYPKLTRIMAAIDNQVCANPKLRTVHVLHDGAWDHPLVYAQHYQLQSMLKDAARAKREAWKGGPMKRVTHSGQVPIGWGEADWSVMIDVELARRAEVFIGNGYSSLSTQVVALRLGDGRKEEDITLY